MFTAFIPYFGVIEKKKSLLEINRASYLVFFVFCFITLYWVGSWQKSADPFLMISGVLLLFFNPLVLLIPSTLYYFSLKIFPRKAAIYFFPLFWVTYEYLYMLTDASFPWLTLGNGLSHFIYFIQIADIIGALGLTLVVVYINILLYKGIIFFRSERIFYKRIIHFSTASLIILLVLIYGFIRLPGFIYSDKKITVGLIQPNLDPWAKWRLVNTDFLISDYLNLSRKAVSEKAELIIWPETALPVYLMSGNYQSILDSVYNFIDENKVSLMTGMPDIVFHGKNIPRDSKYSGAGKFYYSTYNAILFFSPEDKHVGRYGKMKLVPFGERVPFVDEFPFLGDIIKWGVGISGWNVGKDTAVFRISSNEKLNINSGEDSVYTAGLVCYESIYPEFVAAFVQRGANMIAVVTNDSWYGNSSGPYQHKEMAVLRAVENRRAVVRAANGGISTIIDPSGITRAETEMFTKTFLAGEAFLLDDETFFTKHPKIIPLISSLVSLWVFGIFLLKKIKTFSKKNESRGI
jgi:apolipoprotein N-acyltransferase